MMQKHLYGFETEARHSVIMAVVEVTVSDPQPCIYCLPKKKKKKIIFAVRRRKNTTRV